MCSSLNEYLIKPTILSATILSMSLDLRQVHIHVDDPVRLAATD